MTRRFRIRLIRLPGRMVDFCALAGMIAVFYAVLVFADVMGWL